MKKDCACPRARHRHGTRRAYQADKCRCLPCRAAHARSVTAYRHGQSFHEVYIPIHGTRLRLQALAAIGHNTRRIAHMIGAHPNQVDQWRNPKYRQTQITPERAAQVAAVYDQLWDKPDTSASARKTSIAAARRNGWAPPMALDDEALDTDNPPQIINRPRDNNVQIDFVAVDEAVAGRPVKLTKQERAEAIRQLRERGYSARQAAERLRISGRTVQRHSSKAA